MNIWYKKKMQLYSNKYGKFDFSITDASNKSLCKASWFRCRKVTKSFMFLSLVWNETCWKR